MIDHEYFLQSFSPFHWFKKGSFSVDVSFWLKNVHEYL